MAVNRYNANGSLDASFGTNGIFVLQISCAGVFGRHLPSLWNYSRTEKF